MTEKHIKKLPPEVINQIAAGEVVERPASVVKELIENSIDADATIIKLELKDGGLQQIKVWDNGKGISKDDLELTTERHATSKVEKFEDLQEISSYGFRGEALASISAVSNLRIASRSEGESVAYALEFDNQNSKLSIKKEVRSTGTTVEANSIFDNIPARKKFLKTSSTEYRHILNIFNTFALAHPTIAFEFIHNDKKVTSLVPQQDKSQQSWQARIRDVLNIDAEQTVPLIYDGPAHKVQGIILQPRELSQRSQFEYIYVNNRPIQNPAIRKAVKEGYRGFVSPDKSPSFVLDIKVAPQVVDVNTHPRKIEVKFHNPYRIFNAVQQAVSTALEKTHKSQVFSTDQPAVEAKPSIKDWQSLSFAESKRNWDNKMDQAELRLRSAPDGGNKVFLQTPPLSPDDDLGDIGEPQDITATIDDIRQVTQVMDRYLLVDWGEKLWLVDQHAAAERVRYEELQKSFKSSSVEQQSMLNKESISLPQADKDSLAAFQDLLQKIGFKAEFSQEKAIIASVPSIIAKASNIEKLVQDLWQDFIAEDEFQNQEDAANLSTEKVNDILASMACHSSLRAQDKIKSSEGRRLIEELLKCEVPYTCPHGRPLMWIIKQTEIDNHFDRTY